MAVTSPFAVLGLPDGADPDDVRAAWLELCREWHPDRFAGDDGRRAEAEQRMAEVNEAYQAIQSGDPRRMGAGPAGPGPAPSSPEASRPDAGGAGASASTALLSTVRAASVVGRLAVGAVVIAAAVTLLSVVSTSAKAFTGSIDGVPADGGVVACESPWNEATGDGASVRISSTLLGRVSPTELDDAIASVDRACGEAVRPWLVVAAGLMVGGTASAVSALRSGQVGASWRLLRMRRPRGRASGRQRPER